jgi:hypothetical protein
MGHPACNRQGAVTVQPLDTWLEASCIRWRAARLLAGSPARLAWVAAAVAGVAVAGCTGRRSLRDGRFRPGAVPRLTVVAAGVAKSAATLAHGR